MSLMLGIDLKLRYSDVFSVAPKLRPQQPLKARPVKKIKPGRSRGSIAELRLLVSLTRVVSSCLSSSQRGFEREMRGRDARMEELKLPNEKSSVP